MDDGNRLLIYQGNLNVSSNLTVSAKISILVVGFFNKYVIFIFMRNDILEKKDEIIKMIKNNEPKSNICKMLKCKPITLENYLKKMGITYKGNMGLKGKKTDKKRKTALEYLKKEIVVIPKLRKKLIEDGIKRNECEMCGLNEWMNQRIPLELHHIDGDRYNNELENLQILCPNCHSLTPNHSKRMPS